MVSSLRPSIIGAICYSIYAFASVPIWNSESAIYGPLVRIAVFSCCIGTARTLSRAQESFNLRRGLIGGGSVIPVALVISGILLGLILSTRSPEPSALAKLLGIVVWLCSVAAYSFICGMFAAVPRSIVGALFISALALVAQLLVDLFLGGVGAYGRYHIGSIM